MSTSISCSVPHRVKNINYTGLKHASLRTAKILALKCRGCAMCCEWTIAILQCLVGKQGLCVLQMHNCSSSISFAVSSLMTAETKRFVTDKLCRAPSLWRCRKIFSHIQKPEVKLSWVICYSVISVSFFLPQPSPNSYFSRLKFRKANRVLVRWLICKFHWMCLSL